MAATTTAITKTNATAVDIRSLLPSLTGAVRLPKCQLCRGKNLGEGAGNNCRSLEIRTVLFPAANCFSSAMEESAMTRNTLAARDHCRISADRETIETMASAGSRLSFERPTHGAQSQGNTKNSWR